MTATRKTMRFLTVLALILAMVFSIASIPASAAGVETWGSGLKYEGPITINGTNTTPTKTMGASGTLKITANFTPNVVQFSTNVKCVVEIRDLAGRVLASHTSTGALIVIAVPVSLSVTQGQQVRVFFGVYNASTGSQLSSSVSYSHSIV